MPCDASTDPFARLDGDAVAYIIELLHPLDVILLQRVSRSWKLLLSSDWTSRIALIHHFPCSPEAIAFKKSQGSSTDEEEPTISAVQSFRRCVYRSHTRKMGCPTSVSHLILEPYWLGGMIEWGIAGDYVCWVTSAQTTLHSQSISRGPSSRRSAVIMDVVAEHNLPISNEDIAGSLLRIQVADEVLSIILNCYDDIDDDNMSGRRAFIIVFDLAELRFLWHAPIQPPYKMLGEPDTARGNFVYVRKKVDNDLLPFEETGDDGEVEEQKSDAVVAHLMIHDLRSGKEISEVLLERGGDISKGDLFFIAVSNNKFLVVLFQRSFQDDTENFKLAARIYSIYDKEHTPGKMVAEYEISCSHGRIFSGRYQQVRASSHMCVDNPSQLEKFDIIESIHVNAEIPGGERERTSNANDPDEDAILDDPEADFLRLGRAITGRFGSLYSPIHLCPPKIPYNSWDIHATKSGQLNLVPRRFLAEVSLERDFYTDTTEYEPGLCEKEGYPDICSRFEVLLPLEDCAAVFSERGNQRFTLDIAAYEEVGRDEYHKLAYSEAAMHEDPLVPIKVQPNEPVAGSSNAGSDSLLDRPTQVTQPTKLMKQCTRKTLCSKRLTMQANKMSLDGEATSSASPSATGPLPYEIDEKTGTILIKGNVCSTFLPNVQWSEKCITARTNWTESALQREPPSIRSRAYGKPGDMSGIVVFDFSPPW
ncbi:hypothetical protein K440DRAFT_657604 [Wilcoxina mikolae CBS 423.85]|nr:hypothetical protein K440DRAFT_657604 [Wilcoxina mikolae CBS 423.85]